MTSTNTRTIAPEEARRLAVIREAKALALDNGYEKSTGLEHFMIGALAERVVIAERSALMANRKSARVQRGELSPDELGILHGFDEERRQ